MKHLVFALFSKLFSRFQLPTWLLVALFGLNAVSVSGQNPFKLLNPAIPITDPFCIQAFSAQDISVIGSTSFGYHTTNGGKDWKVQDFRRGMAGLTAHFQGKGTGFFTALKSSPFDPGGLIWKTRDSGKTWEQRIWPMNFHRLSFCDSLYGMGIDIFSNQLYRTTNGGEAWALVSTIPPPDPLITNILCEVHQVNPTVVLLRIEHHLYRSTNAGQTWIEIQTTVPDMVFSMNAPVEQVIRRGFGQTYFLQYRPGIDFWRSDDAGLTWKKLEGSNPQPNWPTRSLLFTSPASGWMSAWNSPFVYHSSDTGKTWNLQYNALVDNPDNIVSTLGAWQDSILFIGINTGNILSSHNQGQSWKSIIPGKNVGAGYHRTVFPSPTSTQIEGNFKRQNLTYENRFGRASWSTRTNPDFLSAGLQFLSPALGFRIGPGQVQITRTGGNRWKPMKSPGTFFSENFNQKGLHFFSADSGLIYSEQQIFRTRDSTKTWQKVLFFSGLKVLSDLRFVSPQVGFALLDSSSGNNRVYFIVKTVDAGRTWSILPTGLAGNRSVFGFFALDEQHLWIDYSTILSPGPRGILQSTNGGLSWQYKSTSFSGGRSITFVNPTRGYILKDLEGLYETQDGGANWLRIDSSMQFSTFHSSSLAVKDGQPSVVLGMNTVYSSLAYEDVFAPTVSGKVVQNADDDCLADVGEKPLANRLIQFNPGSYFVSTDSYGQYHLDLEQGAYTATQILPEFPGLPESQFCPTDNQSYPVLVTGLYGDTLPVPPFMNDVVLCPRLQLNTQHFFARPCRESSFRVDVVNVGNQTSVPTELRLRFPAALIVLGSEPALTYVGMDSTWRLMVPGLLPEQSFSILVKDSVVCDPTGLTGQIQCVKAFIPEVPACLLQAPNWDGSDLEVASRCLPSGQARFTIRNVGSAMSQTAQYRIFIDSSLVYEGPFQLAANNSMSVTLPANAPAGFARLVVPQSANHPLSTFASAEANCATGLSTNGLFPPPDQSPLVDIECVMVTNSFDPNDKLVYPRGWGSNGNVEPGTEFKYTIRFQNTGTDTAFKVVLVDTLDPNLDIASLQIGNASHNYTFKVSGKGRPVLTWTFDNILLPDSGRNQEASNGFVSFSIRTKATAPVGTRLENFADIYFDFNDPIRTNTTVNTLWQPTYTPGVLDTVFVTEVKKQLATKTLSIRPNPAQDVLTVHLPEGNTGQLEITDLQGRILRTTQIVSGQGFSIKDLKPGVYFLKSEGYKAERLVVKPF
jgi:uncharacterized repeat protein (TIGR01451 family)